MSASRRKQASGLRFGLRFGPRQMQALGLKSVLMATKQTLLCQLRRLCWKYQPSGPHFPQAVAMMTVAPLTWHLRAF